MALAIATNNAALNAAASASSVNRDMETSMARLSSGKRINSASDDAAGVAISSRLSAEIRGTDQAIRNSLDGQALIDTAEGAHKEIENILQRMREVSVQAANDTNNDQDRQNLQAEMNALITEIDRIAGTTTWAGEKLMESESGSFFSFQVGAATGEKNQIDVTIDGMGANILGFATPPADDAAAAADGTFYTPDGNIYEGATHTMDGVTMSGATHSSDSVTLTTSPPAAGDSGNSTPAATGDPVASISGSTLTVDGTAAADGDLVLSFDAGADITVAVTAGDSVDTIASAIAAAYNDVAAAPVASISGNTLTVDGTAATAGNLVLSLDSGPDITIPLDGNEADAAAIATKIETAVNDAFTEFPDYGNPATVGPSSGTIATANGDGTVTFDFSNPTAALVVSVSGGNYSGQYDGGTLMTIAPNAVGSSGLLELRFDQGSNINVELDGTEADLDAIAAKIVTAINDNIPTTGGNIATANGDGTITFDFSDAGGSGSGFNGVSYVEVRESDPFNTARLEPATSVQINTTTTTVAGVPVATATGSDVVFDFSIAGGDYTDTSSIALGAATDVAQAVAGDDSDSDTPAAVDVPTAPVTSVANADDARVTITAIDEAIKTVNIQRSKLGAVSNRLSHTVNNLTNISSNLSAAQGGIEDADFAHETTMLAKNQILQQASTAMLAQANASKQNVLSLLQG